MNVARIMQVIVGIAGVLALLLGLAIWFAQAYAVLPVHMILGLIVTLGLLIISILALLTNGLRVLGAIGVAYAVFVPIFGLTQASLLVGDLHWLIRIAHLLVGIGAMALIGNIGARYRRLKQAAAS
jgi:uncharacterized membrane protein YuzA (DUF378 family)